MSSPAERHFRRTARLATALKRSQIYEWLVTKGYFPESYVLPPCFEVTAQPTYGKVYFPHSKKSYRPVLDEYLQVHFPKTELTDRTFGIIHPEIHSDIAQTLSRNWKTVIGCLFHRSNKVFAYSFPIPLDRKTPGGVGRLRSGRMIYEFIEMAENDSAAVAYRYKYLITTDIKNFYPSLYTHSIPWALHGKKLIRKDANRYNYQFFGNRLDKLFQNANDGCTNGIPIGPAASDLVSEIVLAGVDRQLSKSLDDKVLVVRFKDDYRILAKTEQDGRSVIKALQATLKDYRLELNDEKTKFHELPSGLFRGWVSEYHSANPHPKAYYSFKRFKEVYLAVVAIDHRNPGTGVIDRFLADVVTSRYKLRIQLNARTIPKIVSLLLMLASLRTKAFPKVLAIIEAVLRSAVGRNHASEIESYLVEFLSRLLQKESENRYLIAWIYYFLRANDLDGSLGVGAKPSDPIVRSTCTSRFTEFKDCKDFRIFQGVKAASKKISMLEHLDVFKPQ
jgi:hypothetical protein